MDSSSILHVTATSGEVKNIKKKQNKAKQKRSKSLIKMGFE